MPATRAASLPRFLLLYAAWLLGGFLCVSTVRAQDSYQEHVIKSAFLYRIAGYVQWPAHALERPHFTIAVIGADDVAGELENLLPRQSIHHRPAQVRRVQRAADIGDAHLLFIGAAYAGDLRQLIQSVRSRPVLVVTDRTQGLDEGSSINFLLLDRRVRFEVSLPAAEQSGLKIGSELLSVAARVRGGPLRSSLDCDGLRAATRACRGGAMRSEKRHARA